MFSQRRGSTSNEESGPPEPLDAPPPTSPDPSLEFLETTEHPQGCGLGGSNPLPPHYNIGPTCLRHLRRQLAVVTAQCLNSGFPRHAQCPQHPSPRG